jgi:hypothetical protein
MSDSTMIVIVGFLILLIVHALLQDTPTVCLKNAKVKVNLWCVVDASQDIEEVKFNNRIANAIKESEEVLKQAAIHNKEQ